MGATKPILLPEDPAQLDVLISQFRKEIAQLKIVLRDVLDRAQRDSSAYKSDGVKSDGAVPFDESRRSDIKYSEEKIKFLEGQLEKLEAARRKSKGTNEHSIN